MIKPFCASYAFYSVNIQLAQEILRHLKPYCVTFQPIGTIKYKLFYSTDFDVSVKNSSKYMHHWYELITLHCTVRFILKMHCLVSIFAIHEHKFLLLCPINIRLEIFRSVALRLKGDFYHFHNGDTRSVQYITSALRRD